MRNKNAAAVLALILGVLGIHRFYLGQYLRGLLYLIYPIVTLTVIFQLTGSMTIIREQASLSGSSDLLPFLSFFLLIPVFDFIWFLVMSKEKFDRQYNHHPARAGQAVLFSLLVLVAGAGFNYLAYQQFYTKSTVEVSGTEADFEMTSADYAQAFSNDQKAAAEKYKGQIVQLSGQVETDETQLSKDGDKRVLILQGDGNLTVRCEFNDAEQEKVQKVEIGEPITVKGSFREVMVFDVVLEDCYLVETEK